jgi:hypothetical protein
MEVDFMLFRHFAASLLLAGALAASDSAKEKRAAEPAEKTRTSAAPIGINEPGINRAAKPAATTGEGADAQPAGGRQRTVESSLPAGSTEKASDGKPPAAKTAAPASDKTAPNRATGIKNVGVGLKD